MPDPAACLGARTHRSISQPVLVLAGLALVALVLIVAFMTVGARGNWSFVLAFRGAKLAAILMVGFAVAVSTVAFQTVTANRILTPSLMGFDALYILINTLAVFLFGSLAIVTMDPLVRYGMEILVMVVFATALFRVLFSGPARSLHLVLLVGIIFGALFRSLTDFAVRLIDPNEFQTLQDMFFASFNTIDTSLLLISAIIIGTVTAIGATRLHVWDVLLLGREQALNLGVDHRREVTLVIILVTILVSTSTALVGPVTFFGLLVANLAYIAIRSHRHAFIMPAAALISVIFLLGGQMILERVLNFNSSLSIVIEFVGGLTFIFLLLRGAAR